MGGDQTHMVVGDMSVQCFGNVGVATPKGAQVYLAKDGLVLRAGGGDDGPSASILIFPDAIVIDAPKTYINPGPTMMASIYAGKSVDQAALDQQSEDRIEHAKGVMIQYQADNGRHTPQGDINDQHELKNISGAGYALTPMADAARDATPGITDSEMSAASDRASNVMFNTPLPAK